MVGLCLTALAGLVGAPPAAAADGTGLLRVAHLSPDTPAVDVAIAPVPASGGVLTSPGPDLVAGAAYGSVSPFRELPAGRYAVSARAAGTPATTPPVLSTHVLVPAGGARTVVVSGWFADLALHELSDDLSAPPGGSARVRVADAAAGPDRLDVALVGGLALAARLPFQGVGRYVVVPGGRTTVRVDGGRAGTADLPLDLTAGSISTLVVLDRPDGGLTVRVIVDAAGPAVVPAGAVEAGTGSTAVPTAALPALAAGLAALVAAASSRRRRAPALAVILAVAALASGVAPAPGDPPLPAHPIALSAAAGPEPSRPARVRVPVLGVDAPLRSIGLAPGGALVPPAGATTAGWYADGPVPGTTGPAVIAGHVDWTSGPAVFFRLREVPVGAEVLVDREDGTTVRFTVTRVARYPKDAFPAPAVYGPTTGAELRLITCGGTFDRGRRSYADNVVVSASMQQTG